MKKKVIKKKKGAKKRDPKSQHWSLRIKTPIADKIIDDVDEGKFGDKSEAVNSILSAHYGAGVAT